jgi:hypothetical protein
MGSGGSGERVWSSKRRSVEKEIDVFQFFVGLVFVLYRLDNWGSSAL